LARVSTVTNVSSTSAMYSTTGAFYYNDRFWTKNINNLDNTAQFLCEECGQIFKVKSGKQVPECCDELMELDIEHISNRVKTELLIKRDKGETELHNFYNIEIDDNGNVTKVENEEIEEENEQNMSTIFFPQPGAIVACSPPGVNTVSLNKPKSLSNVRSVVEKIRKRWKTVINSIKDLRKSIKNTTISKEDNDKLVDWVDDLIKEKQSENNTIRNNS